MARLKHGFKSLKQRKRLQNISQKQKYRWCGTEETRPSISTLDHAYCVRTEVPNISNCVSEETVDESSMPMGWREGRRVIELEALAEGLSACKTCTTPLSLHNCVGIRSHGLAAILKIFCLVCKSTNDVHTGKKRNRVYDMNNKLAAAMLHSGLGESHVNSVLAALNIPTVSHYMLDQRQKEIGAAIERVAEQSLVDSIKEELDLTTLSSGSSSITVSVDAGWQKRGSGKSYDSLSGHCSMIGSQTGKVLGYSVRSKICRICQHAEKNHVKPEQHDCKKNWQGSSKGMEPDMVSEMVIKASERDAHVCTIIGDDDATTLARLRSTVDKDIVKHSDRNHVRKGLGNLLYQLQKKHKTLSTKVIRYLQKCFNYMTSQNKGNPEGITRGLNALSRHPFGDHSICDESWCRFFRSTGARYMSLPYGKALSDQKLQADVRDIFDSYAIHKDKLASLGSTQANESFNKTVSSKAPKSRHYSGSSSLNFRVAASVAQKNIGHSYIMAVNQRLGMSPGTYTKRHFMLKDIQHRKRKAIVSTIKAKQRRLHLKALRSQRRTVNEVREGTTYSSMIGLSADFDADDIVTIPPPLPVPVSEPLSLQDAEEIFFDLEATGLARTSHITQLAAVRCEEHFSRYVIPKVPITPSAAAITGIHMDNGKMFHHHQQVSPVPIKEALTDLNTFLHKSQQNVLIGHNVKTYDCPLLVNAFQACGTLHEFANQVHGFLDTRLLFKITNPGLPSYSQVELFRGIIGTDYAAHDALSDALSLKLLYKSVHLVGDAKDKSTFSLKYCVDSCARSKAAKVNLPSLQNLISEKVLSANMAKKIAASGLCYDHLKLVHRRDGADGIASLFSEKCQNKIRVTNSAKIVNSVSNHISELNV